MYSPAINNLIAAFKKLPGVGEHMAERYVFYLLKSGKKEVTELVGALEQLLQAVKSCALCWNFSEVSPCPICADQTRDQHTLCVVAEPPELEVLEHTGSYRGRYQVLRGLLNPRDEAAPLKMNELLQRLAPTATPKITEVILALNPTLPGETTMLYLEREIKTTNPKITITRLARGLPMGSDLRYADDITLSSAIKNRIQK